MILIRVKLGFDLVSDILQVCIFAYGQTGSGKTHTMLGDPDDFDQMGVIPRSLEQIFKSSEALSFQGWTFQMQVSGLHFHGYTLHILKLSHKTNFH